MIKKFLNKVFKKREHAINAINQAESTLPSMAKVISAKKHKIDPSLISDAAHKTCAGLHKAGFDVYIVGGAVRDLLLNSKPKDFDIATNAEPEEVNKIFRRSRIIGRRFRLVHVMWGRETIEVSTFRGHHDTVNPKAGDAKTNDSGRILRDNIFGSIEDDAARRDFTANALYYNAQTQEVLDFHNGVTDVKSHVLRMIGDPVTRYKEDPVRMLRAVRLSAKLGLKIDKATEQPISKLADLLHDVPPSRLFDEMLKLFLSGHAIESINVLRAQNLHHGLLPLLDVVLEQPMGEKFVMLALRNTDDRIMQGKSSNPSFLFATLLWHEVLKEWEVKKKHAPMIPALYNAMDEVIQIQAKKLAIHNRFVATMKEIWAMQPRFEQRAGKRPFSLLANPRYRAAYDFMLLRCVSGEIPMEIGEWWTKFADSKSEERTAMLMPETALKRKRKRKPKKKPVATDNGSA
ncbi:MAG: poly(A) polymerase [Methylophilaceae bacterium]|jgi:poly(A) polymerase